MANTENTYTGNNSTTAYAFTFPYLKAADIKCSLDGVNTTAFSLSNATTVTFDSAPGTNVAIRIFRETSTTTPSATYFPGSAIKSEDLNDNHLQVLYASEEAQERSITSTGGTVNGDITFGKSHTLTFEGATDDAYETTITVTDPTADRTITLPNVTGTVVTTGDTATVTAAMLAANSVDSDELVDDAVDGTKLANNIDIAGTLDVTSTATFDSNVVIAGNLDINGTTTTIDTTNSTIKDALIELANGTSGSPSNDAGLVIERGSSDNAFIGWDESADKFLLGTGSFTGASTGNLTVTTGTVVANVEGNVTGNADTATALETARTIGGVSFDGTSNINLPGVNTAGNQDTSGTATNSTHVLVTDNESTNENNNIIFIEDATTSTGNAGLEMDGNFFYNPNSGTVTATTFSGALTGNASTATALATGRTISASGDITWTSASFDGSGNVTGTAAIGSGVIVNADVNSSAAIEFTKLENLDSAKILVGNGSNKATEVAVSGDVTIANTGAVTIANDAVTLAKLAGIARGKIIYGDASGNPAVLAIGSNGQVLKSDGTDIEWGDDVASGGAGTFTVADESSDTTCFPVFVTAATGTLGPKSDSQLTYNASSGALGATTFVGNVDAVDGDFDGTLEADAITVDGVALNEYIADTVGGMVSGNTETGLTVTYQDGDNTLDFAADAAQTGITSLLATDIKIGEDDQTKIDFETADEIHFYAANVEQVYLGDNLFGPESDSDVDLGSSSVRWKDAYVDSITVTGEVDGASLDISGNADIDGTLEADAITVDGTALNEYIADTVGAMVGSNTESGITVAYQDADNTLDFTVGTLNQNTTGSAATLTTGRTIGMTGDVVWTSASFNGSGNVTGAATIQSGAVEHAMLAGDAVDGDNLADNACDSEHYTDGSIDHVHLAGDCIDGDNIQDDVVNSEHIAAGAVDLEHMSSESVDEDNLHISNAGSNGQYLQKQSGNSGGLTWADVSSGGDGTPMFAVGDTDGTSIANTTYTALTWNTEFVDSDSAFASDAFTVPSGEGGNYWISFSISVDSVDDGDQWQGVIYKDTGSGYAAYIPSFVYNKSPSNGTELTASWSGIMVLAAGNAIKVYGRHNQGSTQSIKTQSSEALASFSGYKVN